MLFSLFLNNNRMMKIFVSKVILIFDRIITIFDILNFDLNHFL